MLHCTICNFDFSFALNAYLGLLVYVLLLRYWFWYFCDWAQAYRVSVNAAVVEAILIWINSANHYIIFASASWNWSIELCINFCCFNVYFQRLHRWHFSWHFQIRQRFVAGLSLHILSFHRLILIILNRALISDFKLLVHLHSSIGNLYWIRSQNTIILFLKLLTEINIILKPFLFNPVIFHIGHPPAHALAILIFIVYKPVFNIVFMQRLLISI